MNLTQNQVKSLYIYNNGKLLNRISKIKTQVIGEEAGFTRRDGYRQVKICSKSYLSHRVIFLYHHGYLPEFLDHIDNDRSNNNIENLRAATSTENQMNTPKRAGNNNTKCHSKYKGVTWDKRGKKWKAYIQINAKSKHLGRFINESDAAIAYNNAAIKYFGEFAYLNEV